MKAERIVRADKRRRRQRNRQVAKAIPDQVITRRMLSSLSCPPGHGYAIAAPSIGANDTAIQGQVDNYHFPSGLRVHATDTLEVHDLQTYVDVMPEVSLVIFLEGTASKEIDGTRFKLGSDTGPAGHIWSINKPAHCRRLSKKGTHIRKVLVSFPHEWLQKHLPDDGRSEAKILRFLKSEPARLDWVPSKRALALCEQILKPHAGPKLLQHLAIESKAIEIVAEALSALSDLEPDEQTQEPTHRNITRARTVRTFLSAHIEDDLSLSEIARAVGMSVESMQRAFKAAYGTTVVDFIRDARLHLAREAIEKDGISVSEAAYRAGYTSPANFSTAFKRVFGLTPSQARR